MQNPWDVRPKKGQGDSEPEPILLQVGAALSAWESQESVMADVFDALVATQPSNRAAFAAFAAVRSASARHELVSAAAARALPDGDPAQADVAELVMAFGRFGARRNEIAHGRVYNLGKYGYQLGPNNVMPTRWDKHGSAKYQYCSGDIAYYADQFAQLAKNAEAIKEALIQRDIAAGNT